MLLDFDINQGQYNFESSSLMIANHSISGGLGTNVHMKAANQVKFVNGFKANGGTRLKVTIGACGSGVVNMMGDPSTPNEIMESVKVEAIIKEVD